MPSRTIANMHVPSKTADQNVEKFVDQDIMETEFPTEGYHIDSVDYTDTTNPNNTPTDETGKQTNVGAREKIHMSCDNHKSMETNNGVNYDRKAKDESGAERPLSELASPAKGTAAQASDSKALHSNKSSPAEDVKSGVEDNKDDSDLDLSGSTDDEAPDDDSDDDLLDPAAIISGITKNVAQSTERIAAVDEESSDDRDNASSNVIQYSKKPKGSRAALPTSHSSLDHLIHMKSIKEQEDKDVDKMTEHLKNDMSFTDSQQDSQNEVSEETLGAKNHEEIQQLAMQTQCIMEAHPGELVFDAAALAALQQQPLTLASCGFQPGTSYIDRHLANLDENKTDMLLELLTYDTIQLCFDRISCPEELLTWLLRLVSIHSNSHVLHSARKIIFDALNLPFHCPFEWSPSVDEIQRLFLNMGAKADKLHVPDILITPITLESRFVFPGDVPPMPYGQENMLFVIQLLTLTINSKPYEYSGSELAALVVMVFSLSLDVSLTDNIFKHDFQSLINAALNAIPDHEWTRLAGTVCSMICGLSEHHHNLVYLTDLMPPCDRGQMLQHNTSFAIMANLTDFKCKRPYGKIPVASAVLLARHLQKEELPGNLYRLSSIVALLEAFIINVDDYSVKDKKHLEMLSDTILAIHSRIRDDVRQLDTSRVKDIIVRISSKWSFMCQSISQQPTLLQHFDVHDNDISEVELLKDSQSDPEPANSGDGEDSPQSGPSKSPVEHTRRKGRKVKIRRKISTSSSSSMENNFDSKQIEEVFSEDENIFEM